MERTIFSLFAVLAIVLLCTPFSYADETCDISLTEGKQNFNAGNYQTAKELFVYVRSECGSNYKDVQSWINKCNEALAPTTLSVRSSLNFGASGGTETISVHCNHDWIAANTSSSMFSVTRNNNTLTIYCRPNPNASSRSDYFDVKSADGRKSVRVTVSQSGQNSSSNNKNSSASSGSTYLYVSKTSISCSANGTTEYLTVNCNGNWSIQYGSSYMYTTTRSGNTITVRITPNDYTTSRSDYFFVVCGDKKVMISLSQTGKSSSASSSTNNASSSTSSASSTTNSAVSLSVSKTSIITGSSGTTEYLTVSSNRAWEIQFPTGNMYSVTRNGNTLKVTIYANTGTGTREDFFNVRLVDGSKDIKVRLWQSAPVQSQSSSSSYGSNSHHSSSRNRSASNRSAYHQSAYQRFINTNGSVAITWFGISGEIGTGATFTESALRCRLGPIGIRPLDMTGGYDFVYGTTRYAYQPMLDFYIPTSSNKAIYFGAGPSIGFREGDFWFRAEGGLHWEWGVWASSDFFVRYDGMYTVGVSIQWATKWR